jgi:molybdopterin biosynthesis enzyme MoaB
MPKTSVSGTEKTLSAFEKIFLTSNTKVSQTETFLSVAQMIQSDVESMAFETGTLVWELKTIFRVFVPRGSGLAPQDITLEDFQGMLEKDIPGFNSPL